MLGPVLSRIGRAWDMVELSVGGLFLTASVVIVLAEIVNRNLLESSIIGADEIAAFAVIWSVFFTAALAVKKNIHVRIDIALTLLPARAARLLDAAGTALAAVFAAYLTFSGWALVAESRMLGEMTMTSLRMPLWIPQLIMPVGGALLTVRLIQRLVAICFLRGSGTAPAEGGPGPGHGFA